MRVDLGGLRLEGAVLRRAARIANILFRQGFEFFIERTPLKSLVTPGCRREVEDACTCKEGPERCPCGHARPLPDRVVSAVIELGPTFIKFGQIASTRPDLVPSEYSERLRVLQEHVPPVAFDEVRRVVEEELDRPLESAFRRFDVMPIASASLSQVHFAELPEGIPVAVKVQRPGIRETIEQDLAILGWIARQVARMYARVRNLRPEAAVEEFGRWTLRELDFELEGRNYDEFRRNFRDREDIVFPAIYWEATAPRCLTMERVEGLRVSEIALRWEPHEREQIARRLAEIELQMLVTDAFFHADLHPGNIFFKPDGRIVILDVGMVGRIGPERQDRFLCYWVAIERRQRERAFHHLLRLMEPTDAANRSEFGRRYDAILDRFYGASLSERSMAQTYLDILLAASRCGLAVPSEMMLQAKAVVTAEALDLVLYPEFRFTEEARPIVARELARRANPRRVLDRVWSGVAEFILLGESPPAGPASSNDNKDERRFRREVLKALAYTWAEEIDRRLRQMRADTDRYMSDDYWAGRPELQAVLQTAVGLSRLLNTQLDRGTRAAVPESATDAAVEPLPPDSGDTPRCRQHRGPGRHRFREEACGDDDGTAHLWTEDVSHLLAYWEEASRSLADPGYWADKQLLRASVKTLLALLRLAVGQLAQAIGMRNADQASS